MVVPIKSGFQIFLEQISPEQLHAYAQEKEQLFRDLYKKAIEPFGGVKDFIIELECQQIDKAIGTSAPRENVDFVLEKCGLRFLLPYSFG